MVDFTTQNILFERKKMVLLKILHTIVAVHINFVYFSDCCSFVFIKEKLKLQFDCSRQRFVMKWNNLKPYTLLFIKKILEKRRTHYSLHRPACVDSNMRFCRCEYTFFVKFLRDFNTYVVALACSKVRHPHSLLWVHNLMRSITTVHIVYIHCIELKQMISCVQCLCDRIEWKVSERHRINS